MWLDDLPVATLRPTGAGGSPTSINTFYVHADHLGSPRFVTRPSDNAVMWTWTNADPFGTALANENPGGAGTFKYGMRFPGQYYDAEMGTHYNYFRDYDSTIGRFLQSDPIGLGGGINTYAYVGGNPLSFVDPTGESLLPGFVYGAIAGGVGGYISSGGNLRGTLSGALAGGVIGAINPFASYATGAAAGAFTASIAGQFPGNLTNECKEDPFDIDYTQAALAGVAGGGSRVLFTYLGNPGRTAFTYMVNQRMGPMNPVALNTAQAAVRGVISGTTQLAYRNAYYPRGYGSCSCYS